MQFAAPVIALRLAQAKFACRGGRTDALSKLEGFIAKFRRILHAC